MQVVNVVVNWQLPKEGIHWPVSQDHVGGSGVDPSKFSTAKLLVFNWSRAQNQVDFFASMVTSSLFDEIIYIYEQELRF